MDALALEELRRLATDFRHAIERSRAEHATPHLPYFPDGACRLASRLFALHLAALGYHHVRFASGRVPALDVPVRHTWLVVDDMVVDLTADPFGEAAVVVGAATRFHASLSDYEERAARDEIAGFTADESSRYARLLGPIEARLPPVSAR